MRRLLLASYVLVPMGFTPASPSHADSWSTSGTLYAQFAGLSGKTAIGQREADLDVGFSEIHDHLEMAGMMAIRNETDAFALSLNAVFMGLNADTADAFGNLYDLELTQDLVELSWSWRLNEQNELFVGGRYQSLAAEISTVLWTGEASTSFNVESWIDPIVGGRAAWPITDTLDFIVRADVGGFGVGSDLTWSALAVLDWGVMRSLGIVLGYRALDTDYSSGSGANRFEYDAVVAGPMLGVRFNFGEP